MKIFGNPDVTTVVATGTSNQWQIKLRVLNDEKEKIYAKIRRDSTVRASISEDEKELIAMSALDIKAELAKVEVIDDTINAIRHAKNRFNSSYVLPNISGHLTIDAALIEVALLNERMRNIDGLTDLKPKNRVTSLGSSSKEPEYDYVTYDVAKTAEYYTKLQERINKIHEALNYANATVMIDVEIPADDAVDMVIKTWDTK